MGRHNVGIERGLLEIIMSYETLDIKTEPVPQSRVVIRLDGHYVITTHFGIPNPCPSKMGGKFSAWVSMI